MIRPSSQQNIEQARASAAAIVQEQTAAERAALAEQEQQINHELALVNICRVLVPGRGFAKMCEANTSLIESWLNPGEELSVGWFKKVIEEQGLASQLIWEPVESRDPEFRKQKAEQQLAEDQQVFARACRQFRVSENTANFNLIREVLGSGFDVYGVHQAIQSGAVRLAQASQEEIAAWAREAVEQRNRFLLNADNQTLRTIVRRESAERHQAAVQAEADRSFRVNQTMDAAIGFPPLPATWKGEPLTAAFIRTCDVATHKLLTKRFGSAALTARLRGN
jgi:hypothetical protein